MQKKVFIIIATFCFSMQLFAQKEDILQTISVFPYQHIKESDKAIAVMQTWSKKEWKPFLLMLENDSLKLKTSYALHAYTNAAALDPQLKKQASIHLVESLGAIKTYYAKALIIQQLGLLGDDISVKPLAKLLNDANYASSTSMVLATIHSEASINALKKALKKASGTNSKDIEAALENAQAKLPVINESQTWTGGNHFNQNATQQLLTIQKGMDTSKNSIQKKRFLVAASHISSVTSFLFVSNYLSDPILCNDAAIILTKLALTDQKIVGNEVRSTLEKSLPLLKGEDSAMLSTQLLAYLKTMPYEIGFISLFNGKDLTGWKGLVGNPISRAKMTEKELTEAQLQSDKKTQNDWVAKEGLLVFTGHGENLTTVKHYGDFELFVDWKITEKGDAGIYLRGSPQVQIWDTSRREVGAQVGSGGLYNNQKNQSKPTVVADNQIGEWNNFHIIMKGEKVTVYLNGILVTDGIVLENYWDRKQPIFAKEQIELQAHGTYVAYRNIYLREIN